MLAYAHGFEAASLVGDSSTAEVGIGAMTAARGGFVRGALGVIAIWLKMAAPFAIGEGVIAAIFATLSKAGRTGGEISRRVVPFGSLVRRVFRYKRGLRLVSLGDGRLTLRRCSQGLVIRLRTSRPCGPAISAADA